MAVDKIVAEHYSHGALETAILDALAADGKDIGNLTLDDLAPVDELHIGGRTATIDFADRLGIRTGTHLLDVGSGLGGGARYIAATYGCRVTGIDLTEEFCRVATKLAERVGHTAAVEFRQGSATEMGFEDESFDGAYTIHVGMKIPDKAALYGEVRRVVKGGGVFGIYDILRGLSEEPVYPVPWAQDPSSSFLITPDALRAQLETAGFEIVSSRERTSFGIDYFHQMRKRAAESGPAALGPQIVMGADFVQKRANLLRNLQEGRVATWEFICHRR